MQGREEVILERATDIFVDDDMRLRARVTVRNLDPARRYILRVIEVDRDGQWIAGRQIRPAYPIQFHGPWGVEVVDGDEVTGEAPGLEFAWTAGIAAVEDFGEEDRIRVVAALFDAESGEISAISRMSSARSRCSTKVTWRGRGGPVGTKFKPTVTVRCAAPNKSYALTVSEVNPDGHTLDHLATKSTTVMIETDSNGDWSGVVETSTILKAGHCYIEATCAGVSSGAGEITFG